MAASSQTTPDTEPQAPRRVVGYVRLSRETEESSSPAKQRQIIEQTVAARALASPGFWDLVGIESDIDVSATKTPLDDRAGLAKVRAMIADGKADAVVVWRLDRLARSVLDYGVLLKEGLDVVSCTESLDTTTPMGQAMVKILLVFAELESQTLGERLRATIAYRVSQGDRWRGGGVPYGYKLTPHPSGDGKTLVIDPAEAAWVRFAADRVLSGASLYSTVQAFNAASASTIAPASLPRRAEAWSLSSLRVVLTGDSILGRQTRHGQLVRDEHRVIATPWPAVLPLADVERLRARLAPQPLTQQRRKASRLLSGVLVCASCGRRMRVNSRRANSGTVEMYGCRSNVDGKRCAQPASIKADAVEAHVADTLLSIAGSHAVIEVREVLRDVAGLADVEEAIEHTTSAMRIPGANIPELAATLQALATQRDELAAAPREPVQEEYDTGETFGERWERGDVAERRALIESALTGPIQVRPIGRGYRVHPRERITAPWRWDRLTISVNDSDDALPVSEDGPLITRATDGSPVLSTRAAWIIERAAEALALEDDGSTDADVLALRSLLARFRSGDTSAARPLVDLLRLDVRLPEESTP